MAINLVARSRTRRQFKPAVAKAIRLEARISQTELAAALGVSPSAISRWERGERLPRGRLVETYAAAIARLRADL